MGPKVLLVEGHVYRRCFVEGQMEWKVFCRRSNGMEGVMSKNVMGRRSNV